MPKSPNDELVENVAKYRKDPLGYVKFAYEWGRGELAKHDGPDAWQAKVLNDIREGILKGDKAVDGQREPIRISVASGNGVGKSALISQVVDWGMSTHPDTRINITAETETQLRTKTWPEVTKWHNRSITKNWFEITKTTIYSKQEGHAESWRTDRIPWSINNPESFAGLHNYGKMLIMVMDEASAIADVIFETAQGALTDKDTIIIWLVFGNPTRREGYFHDTFDKFKHRWINYRIDGRNVKFTNKKEIQEWLEDYGEDSDWFRVHVRGEEPYSSSLQYIRSDLIEVARRRQICPSAYNFAPVILGLDAAYSQDLIVLMLRQGLYAKILWTGKGIRQDVTVANVVANYHNEYKADACFIDMGWGTGIWSAGQTLGYKTWQLISFAAADARPSMLNKRAGMWYDTKKWLEYGGVLPDDATLAAELALPEIKPRLDGKECLQSKEEIIERGHGSPNYADALALTFALPVKAKETDEEFLGKLRRKRKKEWDPLK